MQRKILIAVLFSFLLLSGCKEIQGINNNKKYKSTLSELEEITDEKYNLEKDLNNAKIKIEELENQLNNLKEELKKENKVKKENGDLSSTKELRIIYTDEKILKYIFNKKTMSAQNVSIVGSNIDNMVENYEEIRIKGQGKGEYFKAEVIGSIYDFQLIKLEWDNEANKLLEVGVLHELDEVRNQTIYIETTLPCGMPSEKIKWKDSEGDFHEVLLANDGYGFDGSIIWSK